MMNSPQVTNPEFDATDDRRTVGTTWWMLDEAQLALRSVVGQVGDAAWDRPTPCSEWNVTQVLQHAAGDQLAWAWSITGVSRAAEDPFSPSGRLTEAADLLVERTVAESAAAFAGVPVDRMDSPTPLPQGPMAANVAAGACALDAVVHAWDIAVATGQPSPLTNRLSAELLPVARAIVEPLRSYGVYAAIVPAGPDDDDSATLLRYLGRQPNWPTTPA
jgi:uncharacterized protein (TIGR03086 family)